MEHVKKTMEENPGMKFKDVLFKAGLTLKKKMDMMKYKNNLVKTNTPYKKRKKKFYSFEYIKLRDKILMNFTK